MGIILMFVPNGLIGNKSALVMAIVQHQAGAKPLPKPLRTKCNNECIPSGHRVLSTW